jgi:hypothetical protein
VSKAIIYIALFFCPFFVSAQVVEDTISAREVKGIPVAADSLVYKDRAFTPKFQEKYKGAEFQYKSKPVTKSGWDLFWEWVGNKLDEIFTFGGAGKTVSVLTIVVRIVLVLIVLFVVYIIVMALLNKEGMWIFGRSRKKIAVTDADFQDIHQLDFGQLIGSTKDSGDYRLAVRYYYLWLLKKMSMRDLINWHRDKTNSDYLYEMKDGDLKKDFEYLSYVYEYSWYGEFPIDARAFAKAEKAFLKTLNTL